MTSRARTQVQHQWVGFVFSYRQNFFPPNDDSVRKPIELSPVSPDGVIKPKNAKDDDTPLNGETTKKGLEKRYKMLKGGFRFPESSHDFKFFNQVGFMIRWTRFVSRAATLGKAHRPSSRGRPQGVECDRCMSLSLYHLPDHGIHHQSRQYTKDKAWGNVYWRGEGAWGKDHSLRNFYDWDVEGRANDLTEFDPDNNPTAPYEKRARYMYHNRTADNTLVLRELMKGGFQAKGVVFFSNLPTLPPPPHAQHLSMGHLSCSQYDVRWGAYFKSIRPTAYIQFPNPALSHLFL
jgi:hypothetical protein